MKTTFIELTHEKDGKAVLVNANNITYVLPNDDERGKFTFVYFNSEKDHVIPVSEPYEGVLQKLKEALVS
ncbi:hypothetical protein [Dinghuibacter silviterrae]|uniref:Uncharacterized protein n=1 Tax=Dinghuibacter silviterrae TaxID=1539049 RepID=A0A4V3GM13_9BACT|nr:hypothetical protein [Dinghuibacter silviterrae]TDX01613.1 hypothetical protein EDB95_2654 [Dinghuibacter silviterrae]